MAAISGKSLYLLFNGTVIDTDYRSFNPTETIDLLDQSAGSDDNRTYIVSLEDGTASVEMVMQADGTAVWNACDLGTEGTLEWAEEGTATGSERSYVNAIVNERSKTIPYADLIIMNISWQFSGDVTNTVY